VTQWLACLRGLHVGKSILLRSVRRGDALAVSTVLWTGIHGAAAILTTQHNLPFGFGITTDEENRQPRSVALENGDSIFVARQRAQRQSEFFEYWSAQLFHIYGLDSANGAPTVESLGRVHPQDRWWKGPVVKLRSASRGPTASFGTFVPSVSRSSTTGSSKSLSALRWM